MSDLSSFLSTQNKAWSAQLWDGFIEAVGARLAPLEENLGIQREVTDAIIARGLTVIEQELTPIVNNAEEYFGAAKTDLDEKLVRFEKKVTGGTVIALSASSSKLVLGETVTLILSAVDREFFAPTPYVAISRASTVNNWAVGKVNSFNRLTGLLAVTLEKVEGAGGPYNDWVITSLPAATMLQQYFYEQTVALRSQVASDKSGTAADKSATATARDEAISARSGAVAAKAAADQVLADMRKAVAPPVVTPTSPVEGQLWWDGTVTRVYQSGVGYVPTVTVSIGGRRYEKGTFGPNPDGVITVGGGFTAALVFVNGKLLDDETQYIADSPTITVIDPMEGDSYFVEAYLSTSAVDYYTKEQVDNKVGIPNGIAGLDDGGKVPNAQLPNLTTTATVGAAIAGANGKATPSDGDFFTGVVAGSATMFKSTWANVKAALQAVFDDLYIKSAAPQFASNIINFLHDGLNYLYWRSAHVAFTKKAGAYRFYWRINDTGAAGGANEQTLMSLSDSGLLYTQQGFSADSGSASMAIQPDGNIRGTTFGGDQYLTTYIINKAETARANAVNQAGNNVVNLYKSYAFNLNDSVGCTVYGRYTAKGGNVAIGDRIAGSQLNVAKANGGGWGDGGAVFGGTWVSLTGENAGSSDRGCWKKVAD